MSYHTLEIPKVPHTSPFKIYEEFLEYIDALSHKNKIMAATELSDLFLCIKSEAFKLGLTVKDLDIMASKTKEVFETGSRPCFNLFEYLIDNGEYIVCQNNCHVVVIGNITYYVTENSVPNSNDQTIFSKNAILEILKGTPVINSKMYFTNDLEIIDKLAVQNSHDFSVFRVIHESKLELSFLDNCEKLPMYHLQRFTL
jgi:hypothetical protein